MVIQAAFKTACIVSQLRNTTSRTCNFLDVDSNSLHDSRSCSSPVGFGSEDPPRAVSRRTKYQRMSDARLASCTKLLASIIDGLRLVANYVTVGKGLGKRESVTAKATRAEGGLDSVLILWWRAGSSTTTGKLESKIGFGCPDPRKWVIREGGEPDWLR
jgi:hypothetical protein